MRSVLRVVIACLIWVFACSSAFADIQHKKVKRWLNGRPAIVNIITVNRDSGAVVKPVYGNYSLNHVKTVKALAYEEKALAGINASFFKPDIGTPLGVSIIDGEIMTGPIYSRVVFGITDDNTFLMDKVDISGRIKIGETLELNLVNYNQPVLNNAGYTVFTDRWGSKTPRTSTEYCHVIVVDNKIELIKQSSVYIPKGGYVLVGPRKFIKGFVNKSDPVSFEVTLTPTDWNQVKYAVGGGPYLVKDGQIFIDRQMFNDRFLWRKEPRTAIGYTKEGTLVLVTVDGRKQGVTEGATLPELARIMWELGCCNAMNLDGGSSTQMVYNGEVVNQPTIRGGGKVTNALLVVQGEEIPANVLVNEIPTREQIEEKIRQYELNMTQ